MSEPEPSSVQHYALVLGSLLALLGLTVGAAFLHLGAWSTPVAMGIALAKAALILVFFMHLRRAGGLIRIFAAAGFFWLVILFLLTLNDFLTRS